ncbi:hypothetical protein SAY86_029363 [Trapa natans]|uniref:Uncharacterized protein n=1 Tax=Trapa natans TaxID=22666 RepID=A0AAN7M366_TRANT|nr:hypothetical protein SAY86_029363 [Trapa natans]
MCKPPQDEDRSSSSLIDKNNPPPDDTRTSCSRSKTDGFTSTQSDHISPASPNRNSSSTDESTFHPVDGNLDGRVYSSMKGLWWDEANPIVDASWNMQVPSTWEDNWPWLLDCEDFGVHDFGIDCSRSMDMETVESSTLEVGIRH